MIWRRAAKLRRLRRRAGRAGIGFGVRAGAPKPDVRTPHAVKQTRPNAKSLTWVSAGASRAHIDQMTEALGIASAIKSKTVLTNGVDESNDLVAAGKNEMIVTLISEILPAKGVQYVGPLPDKFQSYVTFAAGVSPKAKLPAAGALFIKQLIGVRAAEVYVSKGMGHPVRKARAWTSGRFRSVRNKPRIERIERIEFVKFVQFVACFSLTLGCSPAAFEPAGPNVKRILRGGA